LPDILKPAIAIFSGIWRQKHLSVCGIFRRISVFSSNGGFCQTSERLRE